MEEFDSYELENNVPSTDPYEIEAVEVLEKFFNDNKDRVFYGRQLEIIHEDRFFHWVTNRAIRFLAERGIVKREIRRLKWGGNITLYWYKSFRYFKSEAKKVIDIVESYSIDKIGSSTGGHCELLVVEAFAKFQYLILGRGANEYKEKKWVKTNHDVDIIVEKDGVGYGIEIKNTLGYIPKDEYDVKVDMCLYLGLKPVFAIRMLPKNWTYELIRKGGYAMILKYLLYPEYFHDVALKMKNYLKLPVECPKSLAEGTITRFDNWHMKHVNLKKKSQ